METGIDGIPSREENWNHACPVLAGNPTGDWHGENTAYPMCFKSSQKFGWQGLFKTREGSVLEYVIKRGAERNAATPGLWRLGFRQSSAGFRTKKANESTLAGTRLKPWAKESGTTTLDQNRQHTVANEIDSISETTGPSWPTPDHDDAGNMTEIPRPLSPSDSYSLKWDAWSRLVEVKENGGSTVAAYAYDATHRRITKETGGTTRHYYYSDQWQVLEERLGSETVAERRYVWGTRGIDDLILRDRDPGGGDSGESSSSEEGVERLYALSDGMNVTAIVDDTGAVAERYGTTGFGSPEYLTPAFGNRGSSDFNWETLFHAYRYDLETGLYQVRHRYLHPKLGRWVNRDPIEEGDGVNVYAFVGNDPVNYLDFRGLSHAQVLSAINEYLDDYRNIKVAQQLGWVDAVVDLGGVVNQIDNVILGASSNRFVVREPRFRATRTTLYLERATVGHIPSILHELVHAWNHFGPGPNYNVRLDEGMATTFGNSGTGYMGTLRRLEIRIRDREFSDESAFISDLSLEWERFWSTWGYSFDNWEPIVIGDHSLPPDMRDIRLVEFHLGHRLSCQTVSKVFEALARDRGFKCVEFHCGPSESPSSCIIDLNEHLMFDVR